jgi:hypothetical protein
MTDFAIAPFDKPQIIYREGAIMNLLEHTSNKSNLT